MALELHLNRLEERDFTADLGPLLRRAVRETLTVAGAPEAGEVSVTLLEDGEIRELNRRYLGKDRATDVLAFGLGEEGELLGDVYVAPDLAARGAVEHGATPREELVHLVVHGVLHLLGHDHPGGEARYGSEMFRVQEEVIGRLGL